MPVPAATWRYVQRSVLAPRTFPDRFSATYIFQKLQQLATIGMGESTPFERTTLGTSRLP